MAFASIEQMVSATIIGGSITMASITGIGIYNKVSDVLQYDNATPIILFRGIEPSVIHVRPGEVFNVTINYDKRIGCQYTVGDKFIRDDAEAPGLHVPGPNRRGGWPEGKDKKAIVAKQVPVWLPSGTYRFRFNYTEGKCDAVGGGKATSPNFAWASEGPWIRVIVEETNNDAGF